MNDNDAREKSIDLAIKECQNVILPIGTIIAHVSEKTALELVKYQDDTAVCLHINGKEMIFPANEIFDVNEVKRISKKIYMGLLLETTHGQN